MPTMPHMTDRYSRGRVRRRGHPLVEAETELMQVDFTLSEQTAQHIAGLLRVRDQQRALIPLFLVQPYRMAEDGEHAEHDAAAHHAKEEAEQPIHTVENRQPHEVRGD